MGGKGIRRREKNYRAAHGGANLLPPPPKASSVDALPSKLRQLMTFTAGTLKSSKIQVEQGKKKIDKKPSVVDEKKPMSDEDKNKGSGLDDMEDDFDEEKFNEGQNLDYDNSSDRKKKKKRKRNQVNDLRFEETAKMLGISSKKKERKKKYLEEKKKKKKAKTEDAQGLHRHEKIAFGDVVEAPPKLSTVPKAFKSTHDALKERLRLNAVDAYRQRKGWVSRPGINLPPPVTSTPLV